MEVGIFISLQETSFDSIKSPTMAQSLAGGSDRDLQDVQRTAETENGGTTVAETEREKDSSQSRQSNGADAGPDRTPTGKKDEQASKTPSKLMGLWGKVGLDLGTVLMMFK